MYLKLGTIKETADFFKCDPETVTVACKNCNIAIKTGQQHNKEKYGKKVIMLPENIIFNSLREASEFLIQEGIAKTSNPTGVAVHIRNVCNGKRKNAYKHQWMFI